MNSATMTFSILLITFLIYLIQDGRTLMLSVFAPFNRKINCVPIFNDVLPSWDGNQTWLVFTIAGLYGAFPIFLGQLMSRHYTFFFLFLLLLILRGASIEFYMKSTKSKSWWLLVLSLSSFLILVCHVFLCVLLLRRANFSTLSVLFTAVFIIWSNFSQAYCFLFKINHFSRLNLLFGLFLSSAILLSVCDTSIWGGYLTSIAFLCRLGFFVSFLTLSILTYPSQWLSKKLPFYLFIINAFIIFQKLIPTLIMTDYDQVAHVTNNSAYFVINVFSILFLPLIALGLSKMKKVFSKNPDEISY